jgi:hypothetical protein
MSSSPLKPLVLIATILVMNVGCAGEGRLSLTTWGEEFIEEGLPAEAFADGWSVTFSKFLVVFAEARVADDDGSAAIALDDAVVVDLVPGGPVTLVTAERVLARRYNAVEVVIAPSTSAVAAGAEAADVAFMTEGGWSVHVEGRAARDANEATFAWSFATATRAQGCQTVGDGEGQVVRAGHDNEAQLTVHGDHLFFDDLAAGDAAMRFEPLFLSDGADGSEANGVITLEELGAVDLTTLPPDRYGNAGNAETLADFVAALSRTLVHFNGEGECSISSL